MNPEITVQPTQEPVSLMELKQHLRLEFDFLEDDSVLSSMLTQARVYTEGIKGLAYVTRTYRLWLNAWPDVRSIELPFPPLQSVTSVTWYDKDDAPTVLSAATDYRVVTVSWPGRIVLRNDAFWPTATLRAVDGIEVVYVAGYGDPVDVPETEKSALKLAVGHWYENREATTPDAVTEMPFAVRTLLNFNRVNWF